MRFLLAAILTLGICALSWAQQGSRVVDSIVATTCAASNWVNAVSATGAATCAQPAASNLSNGTTGTGGTAVVLATSPTLVTPVLGAASATSLTFGGGTCSTYTATTWTPTYIGDGTAGTGQTYTVQVGSYEQICRQVVVRWRLTASSLGTAAGNLNIGGLPVASSSATNDLGVCVVGIYAVAGLAALSYGIVGHIFPNTSAIVLNQNGNAATAAVTIAQAGATVQTVGMCNYHV